jgi:hypothetical protein
MNDVSTADLLHIMARQQDHIEQLRGEIEVLRGSHMLLEHRLQQDGRTQGNEIDRLRQQVGFLVSREALEGGLLPALMEHVSLIAVQVFHTVGLTPQQRKARHTEWSMKLEVSVGNRRVKKGISVSLYPGEQFARQVFDTNDAVPQTIAKLADGVRDENDPDRLYGMLKRLTSGGGTPRKRTQFCCMRGHLLGNPTVLIEAGGVHAHCKDWRPGAGAKAGKALWYGTCKPQRSDE